MLTPLIVLGPRVHRPSRARTALLCARDDGQRLNQVHEIAGRGGRGHARQPVTSSSSGTSSMPCPIQCDGGDLVVRRLRVSSWGTSATRTWCRSVCDIVQPGYPIQP
jgi:hypothetical protein